MLYNADAILNQRVEATDGVVGIVSDLYFDDTTWTLRYLVVDTGGWLTGRNVLISSEALLEFNEETATIATNLSQQQIEASPPAKQGQPISRLNEIQLSQYYGWSPYWTGAGGLFPWTQTYRFPRDKNSPETGPSSPHFEAEFEKQSRADPNLRGYNALKNYSLRASDGDIGQVENLLIEPGSWKITHLIVDVRLWWPGGLVAIDRALINDISWSDRSIVVAMTRDEVRKAPPYDKNAPVSERFQTHLSDYYQGFQHHKQRPMIPSHPWIDTPPSF